MHWPIGIDLVRICINTHNALAHRNIPCTQMHYTHDALAHRNLPCTQMHKYLLCTGPSESSLYAHKYTHLRHEESKGKLTAGLGWIFWSFCIIILRNMSMLIHIPSSWNSSLNHVLDCEKVFEICKTHQDNYSDKDSKCKCVIKIFLHLA